MYYGSYRHSLDAKGRAFLPAKFRARLSGGVMVAPWAKRHLLVVDKDAWPAFASELKQARQAGTLSASMELAITSEASDEAADAQGRISIPQRLREYARIERDVWFLGRGDRIEIVSAEIWDPQRDQALDALAEEQDLPV